MHVFFRPLRGRLTCRHGDSAFVAQKRSSFATISFEYAKVCFFACVTYFLIVTRASYRAIGAVNPRPCNGRKELRTRAMTMLNIIEKSAIILYYGVVSPETGELHNILRQIFKFTHHMPYKTERGLNGRRHRLRRGGVFCRRGGSFRGR